MRARKRTLPQLPVPPSYDVQGGLWLANQGQNFLGGKRIALLEAIASTGSITHAAKSVGLSYKGAWDMVDAMNNLAEQPLVTRGAGGARGGGTQLTEYGHHVIQLYRQLETGHQKLIQQMSGSLHDTNKLNELIRAIGIKTSARNQFRGIIKLIRKGAVNADVLLDLGDGLTILANITNESVIDLGLKKGKSALALIKSSWVMLSTDRAPAVSASNKLLGTISQIRQGPVNSEIKLDLAGGRTLVAIISAESLTQLGLQPGMRCYALINASHVIVATHD